MAQTEQDLRTPPFGPWVTFKNFVQDLKGTVIPPRIDHTMFRGKSGSDARHVRATLRFFGLTKGEAGEVSPALRDLVQAFGTDQWPGAVRGLLESQYGGVLGGVDLDAGTQGQLEDAFRTGGNVTGSTLRKAVRFYLAAAKEAGMKLSPHFVSVRAGGSENGGGEEKPAGSSPTPTARRRRVRRGSVGQHEEGEEDQKPPEGVEALRPLPGKDFRIWIPNDLSEDELAFALDYLRRYVKLKHASKGAK